MGSSHKRLVAIVLELYKHSIEEELYCCDKKYFDLRDAFITFYI